MNSGSTAVTTTLDYVTGSISDYPYLHVTVNHSNMTSVSVTVTTDTGPHVVSVTKNGTNVFAIGTYGKEVRSISISANSDGRYRVLVLDEIVLSAINTPVDKRLSVNMEYSTSCGSTTMVADDHLLSWDTGIVTLYNSSYSWSQCITQISEWTTNRIVINQTVAHTGVLDDLHVLLRRNR